MTTVSTRQKTKESEKTKKEIKNKRIVNRFVVSLGFYPFAYLYFFLYFSFLIELCFYVFPSTVLARESQHPQFPNESVKKRERQQTRKEEWCSQAGRGGYV